MGSDQLKPFKDDMYFWPAALTAFVFVCYSGGIGRALPPLVLRVPSARETSCSDPGACVTGATLPAVTASGISDRPTTGAGDWKLIEWYAGGGISNTVSLAPGVAIGDCAFSYSLS
jgi:hypothetical protein